MQDEWTPAGDDKHCLAPDWYSGGCPNVINFSGLSPLDKIQKGQFCGFQWACDGCAENFEAACPSEWSQNGDLCVAPSDYEGPCIREVSFNQFSKVLKKKWGTKCGVQWPC